MNMGIGKGKSDKIDIDGLIEGVGMGRITKRFFSGEGKSGERCLFIGSYGRGQENDR